MVLPGKITLCRLEEDIPAKSFFRIRPLLINGENGLELAEGALEQFGDEGGIRIVPDRNEVARFKTRMRTLGSFCLLDLVRHTGENDKIRPNKNYSPERGEMNRNIVYSDVITACPDGSIMEVITPDKNEQGIYCAPEGVTVGTRRVLLRADGVIKGPYIAERKSEEENYIFSEDAEICLSEVDESALYNFEGGISLFISSSIVPVKTEEPVRSKHAAKTAEETKPEAEIKPEEAKPAEEGKPAEEAKPAEEVKPAEEAKPAEETVSAEDAAPAEETKPAEEAAPIENTMPAEPAKPAEAVHKPAEQPKATAKPHEAPKPAAASKPAEPAKPAEAHKPAQRPEPEKPPRQMPPREFNKNTPPAKAMGLNPRRSMSLAEYVDDSWKRARFEQLSANVTSDTASTPVLSPVEKTAAAVRDLMRVPEGRAALVKELGEEIFAVNASVPARDTHMDELEAERLRLLCEIDGLKKNLTDTRAGLMAEALHAHAAEAARMEEEKARLDVEIEARRREADSARHAQAEAAKLMDSGSRAKLDNEFLRFAMFSKAAQLLQDSSVDFSDYAGIPETSSAAAEQMVNELRARFEEAGRRLTNDEAVNLLVCSSVGATVMLSGATGSGKTTLADSMAGALGLNTPGCRRYLRFGPDVRNARNEGSFKAMMRYNDLNTQRFILLDDINAYPCPDQSRGLMENDDPTLTVFMTILDDQVGYPVDTRLLDRAFVIRVKAPVYDSWKRAAGIPSAHRAPSLESVKSAFLTSNDIPAEVVARMKSFTDGLKEMGIRLSARTLSDMYAYCAAACPLMSKPIKALDYAIAQRALPVICATAKLYQLKKLPELVCDLPESSAVLSYPLPVNPIL